jgi:transposase
MLAPLDPLGLPVATDVLPGQRADDPLSMPAITRVRKSLGGQGLLSVGDCTRAALATRACLQAGGDFYVCPLSEHQRPVEALAAYLTPVWAEDQGVTPITRVRADGTEESMAQG